MNVEYLDFVRNKTQQDQPSGFECADVGFGGLPPRVFRST